MIYLGIFCFLYYIVIRVYTRRRNSTFLLFWFLAGMTCFVLEWLKPFYPLWLQENMRVFLIPWAIFAIIELFIGSAMFHVARKDLSYIIVLGAQIRGTVVTNSLERRLNKAIEYLNDNIDTKVIVSGGQGNGEDTTEAKAMKTYLVNHGIHPERVLLEDRSTTTEENLKFSKELIEKPFEPVGIVTNNFHMFRALKTAKKIGIKQAEGIPASSNPILFLNYMVREFFACIYYTIWKR